MTEQEKLLRGIGTLRALIEFDLDKLHRILPAEQRQVCLKSPRYAYFRHANALAARRAQSKRFRDACSKCNAANLSTRHAHRPARISSSTTAGDISKVWDWGTQQLSLFVARLFLSALPHDALIGRPTGRRSRHASLTAMLAP